MGDFGRAAADYQKSLALDAESPDAYRSLAWLLATCPDPQFRHPEKALLAAERAARLAPPGDPFVLDALAAAHASAGHFDQAVRYQREAISVAPEGFAEPFAARLALYEQRQPFRNAATGREVDASVDAASLERPVRQQ
jgi:tetratricopeptide (TPR) repeat protein